MTKKSHARLQRDAQEKQVKDARDEVALQIKGNTIYDDIHHTYQECGLMLAGYAQGFNALKISEAAPRFTPEQTLKVNTLASGFHTDITNLQQDLINIRKPYIDKTGGETNVDAFIGTTEVAQQFAEFVGRSKGVLDPTFRSIAAEVSSVRELAPEQDPTVITDVEVKQANVPT